MKVKNTILVLSFSTLLNTAGVCAEAFQEERGVTRLQPVENYCSWRYNCHHGIEQLVFGYQLRPESRPAYGYGSDGLRPWIGEETPRIQGWKDNPAIVERSFNRDLAETFLDSDRFYTHLAEGNYGAAWRMSAANEQGNLWKRQAVARAKTDVVKFAQQGIFRHKDALVQKSVDIVESFYSDAPGAELTEVYQALTNLHQSTCEAALKERADFLQRPEVALISDALRAYYVDRLLGEER